MMDARFLTSFTKEQYEDVRRAAYERHMSLAAFVRMCCEDYLARANDNQEDNNQDGNN